jgi:hypothetical protein
MNPGPSRTTSGLRVFTAGERPDLWIRAKALSEVWPEYNNHGNRTGTYFGSLIPNYAHLQVVIYEPSGDEVVARGRSIPLRWDGSLADLPDGIDAAGLRALEGEGSPNTLSALAAEVADGVRGKGVSHLVIEALSGIARTNGLGSLVAPVRPSWKDRYPLIPIDQYAYWKRPDGLPFDPWMRVHARLGATILRPEPRSLMINAPVSDWETWTDMKFPADGDYTFPFGLAPLRVGGGTGLYWEPNVWMLHAV